MSKRLLFVCPSLNDLELPKPLVPINEKPVIEHIIDKFIENNVSNFLITSNYKSKILKAYFQELKNMAMINPDYKIVVNKCALGEEEGIANIDISSSSVQNIGWNTMVPGLMREEQIKKTLKVPVYRLDNYIKQKALKNMLNK